MCVCGVCVCAFDSFSGIKSATFILSFSFALLGYLYLFLTSLTFVPFLSILLLSCLYARSTSTSPTPRPRFISLLLFYPFPSSPPLRSFFFFDPRPFVLVKCHRQSAHPLTLLVVINLLHHAQHLLCIAPNAST